MKIDANTLRNFYFTLLQAVNTPPKEAGITADALIDADLHDHETHGAIRIPPYIKVAKEGRLEDSNIPFLECGRCQDSCRINLFSKRYLF